MSDYNENIKESIQTISDCFDKTDGGESFIKVKIALEQFSKDANNKNNSAIYICDLVNKFAKLIKVLNKAS